ncbi:MAG: ATP-binding protein, partial [Candidatus Cloacimonetes bacterium]|nr:ATP-binding protein [Candidatus Cloacimonadota bacterium]
FEDERLPVQEETLSALLPAIQETWGQKPKYLFLDELQNMPNWSRWLRRLIDTEEIRIIVTGSSSKMSSFEIPTELRGRFFEIQVFPLSLAEYLRFKKEKIDFEKLSHLPSEQAKFNFLFEEYLTFGGLPEVVLLGETGKKMELLQNYYQTVVSKEIIERFNVKNQEGLKVLLRLLLNSTHYTVSNLYNSLKSLNQKIGKTTLNNYLSYIESSYFLKPLFYLSPSLKNQLQYPRKPYFIDNGFIFSLSTKFSKNFGRLFENFSFWQLYKKYKDEIFYYQDRLGREVDFVIFANNRPEILVQVCWDATDFETREREERALVASGKTLKCEKLFIVAKEVVPAGDSRVKVLGVKEFLDFLQ